MKRYGVIGAGMMGREHIANLKLIDGAELVAVADTHAPSLEATKEIVTSKSDIAYHKCYREMSNRANLDAVIVATPNHTHLEIFEYLADQDIAVLMEKPLCSTVEDARHLQSLCARAKARICVGP